ncbi:MAG TPA: glycosyltransferase [Sedimenticola sp.]|nr:glycosyltransferase [Sedimenticola sp.]
MQSKLVNVLHLIQGLDIGGLEIMVINLLKRLDRERYHSSVCCFDTLGSLAPRLTEKGIEVHLLKRNPGVDFSYIIRLAKFLRKQNTQILHLHNPTAFFYGAIAGKLAGTPGIIYTEHGRDFSSSKKVRFANRMLSRLVDKVVTVADFGKRFLVEEEGIAGNRITTIHNGIDGARFGLAADELELRSALGLKEDQVVIGIVARLDPIKNHAVLLKAMQQVVAARPSSVLLVIGDGPLRGDLESQTKALGLEANVRFLGARQDVPDLLHLLDLFVLCSRSEGLSLTLIEACAAARPIIATDVGGNSEVVEHGVNGLIVPSGQPEALAKAMMELLDDADKARRMGASGRQKFEREFTLDAMVQAYERLYASRAVS